MTIGSDSAFPTEEDCAKFGQPATEIIGGLTKREYFAGLAMQGFINQNNEKRLSDTIALYSVRCADALIAELNKGEKQ